MKRFTWADYLLHEAKHNPAMALDNQSSRVDAPESKLQQAIEDHLKSLGPTCWYVRQRMDQPTSQRKGVPDFIGWYKGKPFAIEVKRKGKKATPEQQADLYWAKTAGAMTAVVTSLKEVVDLLRPIALIEAEQIRQLKEIGLL